MSSQFVVYHVDPGDCCCEGASCCCDSDCGVKLLLRWQCDCSAVAMVAVAVVNIPGPCCLCVLLAVVMSRLLL
jgi:hypothetical protein